MCRVYTSTGSPRLVRILLCAQAIRALPFGALTEQAIIVPEPPADVLQILR